MDDGGDIRHGESMTTERPTTETPILDAITRTCDAFQFATARRYRRITLDSYATERLAEELALSVPLDELWRGDPHGMIRNTLRRHVGCVVSLFDGGEGAIWLDADWPPLDGIRHTVHVSRVPGSVVKPLVIRFVNGVLYGLPEDDEPSGLPH